MERSGTALFGLARVSGLGTGLFIYQGFRGEPQRITFFQRMWLCRTTLLTGFAMRIDPKGFSEVSAPLTADFWFKLSFGHVPLRPRRRGAAAPRCQSGERAPI